MSESMKYKEFWNQKFKEEEKSKKEKIGMLKNLSNSAAHILISDFGAKKVYLFGSILKENVFHKRSDLDFAVEGLDPKKYFSALSKISGIFEGKTEIDIIPLEDATPKLKEKIIKEGKLLNA